MSTPRSKARRWAFQLVYQVFANGPTLDLLPIFAHFWENVGEPVDDAAKEFTEERVRGVIEQRMELDALIEQHSKNWRVDRMAPIDLAVMRLGAWELKCSDLPTSIVINEAVDLAKQFSSADASAFVNGVLDSMASAMDRNIVEPNPAP